MTDTPLVTSPVTPATGPEAPKPEAPPKAETDWKAEAKKWETRAKENSTAAARLAEIEEAQKTEQQRLTERAEAAEKQATEARLETLRSRVALSKSLPADLVDRLRGDNEDELAADADRLLALIQPGKPRGDVAQGPRGGEGTSNDPGSDFAKFIGGQLNPH